MIDLCLGPHVPHTGRIKAFMVTKVHHIFKVNLPRANFCVAFRILLAWRLE